MKFPIGCKVIDENKKDIPKKMKLMFDVFGKEIWDENETLEQLIKLRPKWLKDDGFIGKWLIDKEGNYIGGAHGRSLKGMKKEIEDRMTSDFFLKILTSYNKNIKLKEIFWLDNIFLEKSRRGHHAGMILYKGLEDQAKKKGFKHIVLDTKAKKFQAIEWYKALGFEEVAAFKKFGQRFIEMIKKIK